MTPAEAFALTPEEQVRLDGAPFRADEGKWGIWASHIHLQVLKAYADGEITLERALEIMWSSSLGCRVTDRITLMAHTARRALQNRPKKRKGKRQPNPLWVRKSAATLVEMLHEARPDEPLTPNDINNWTTPILADAIKWLVTLGLCEPIHERTLYKWYREARMRVRAKAYFDESGEEELPGYFGVAGFAGSEHQWSVFEKLWKEALEKVGAPYLHMREFAHSVDAFKGWRKDRSRREQLMTGVVTAILESELTAVGSAMRVEDFDALKEEERRRLVSPYYCCLQDVLWGFALMTEGEDPPVEMHVTGDQHKDGEEKAKKLLRALRRTGPLFANLVEDLEYADMRQTFGLQAADLLAYEMVKELKNQDSRPENRMRWPLDQILSDPESPRGKMLKYTTAEMLQTQASGQWKEQGGDVVTRNLDESLRILRDKSEAFKRRLQDPKRP